MFKRLSENILLYLFKITNSSPSMTYSSIVDGIILKNSLFFIFFECFVSRIIIERPKVKIASIISFASLLSSLSLSDFIFYRTKY